MKELTDYCPMPYGKYKGMAMANVPAEYLLWMFKNKKCTKPVERYIVDNLEVLQKEVEQSR